MHGKDSAHVAFAELRGHSRTIYGVSQCYEESSDGSGPLYRLILSTSADESIRLWDSKIGNCIARYSLPAGLAWAVQFSPYGYFFAACNQNGSTCIYSTERTTPLRVLSGHTSDVNCCYWHPNYLHIATGSDDQSVRLWDLRTGQSVRHFKGCGFSVSSLAITSSGELLSGSCQTSGSIATWDVGTGKILAKMEAQEPIYSMDYSPDGRFLGCGGSSSIKLWSSKRIDFDMFDGRLIAPSSVFHTKNSEIYSLKFNRSNLMIAGGPVLL
jgi:transcription initiation factor TFIID subunit 5